MRGIPQRLNTRKDYENIREMFPADQWMPRWQELLGGRWTWTTTATLAPEEAGVEDATHRIIEDDAGGELVRLQQELVEDANAKIFRLGFTVAEIEAALAGA